MSVAKPHRWSKFWWQDYERDPALRSCSLSAQGLWMRMLCFMHEGEPYGHLTVNGRAPDTKRLAAMIGKAEREVSAGLSELEEAGVFSRDESGIIFSRRLKRDKATSDEAREHGVKGGNPSLKGPAGSKVNGGGNGGGLTPPLKHQEAEAKRQEEEPPYAPQAPAQASPQAARPRTRVSRSQLPSDWLPGKPERDYARQHGLDPDATGQDFRDYWVGHGKPMANWLATWQRWCREAQRRNGSRGGFASMPRENAAERRIRETQEAMHRMTYPERYADDGVTIDHQPEQRTLLQ